jgi:hypothetical protein
VGGACSTDGGNEKCVHDFGWKACREETTRKTRRRWEDNIKMYLSEADQRVWIALISLRIETDSGLL